MCSLTGTEPPTRISNSGAGGSTGSCSTGSRPASLTRRGSRTSSLQRCPSLPVSSTYRFRRRRMSTATSRRNSSSRRLTSTARRLRSTEYGNSADTRTTMERTTMTRWWRKARSRQEKLLKSKDYRRFRSEHTSWRPGQRTQRITNFTTLIISRSSLPRAEKSPSATTGSTARTRSCRRGSPSTSTMHLQPTSPLLMSTSSQTRKWNEGGLSASTIRCSTCTWTSNRNTRTDSRSSSLTWTMTVSGTSTSRSHT